MGVIMHPYQNLSVAECPFVAFVACLQRIEYTFGSGERFSDKFSWAGENHGYKTI